ncbi:CRISPR-associated Cse2 family protein [Levilactobacillus namurensis DSM 19117]|uniref:CRISPR-associated Cse2 family protein n=1 Tax=Levilactobacillus namurensis DSM 19117 TaxID=1423773 RepID=A0A0R1JYE2_9LACO|nr:type I-E CRISPR-associated protein Cse2/CasB [Levilactobacillus namurensis]KRK72786.1 CRISPR-associated Cse2 family protein [Levilactobacillus namurensis DSM 19117]
MQANDISFVTNKIIRKLNRDEHPNKAALASIRGAATLTSPRAQGIWPILLANLDKEMLSSDGYPTYAEVAIYAAVRFYAIHQQGQEQLVYEPTSRDEPTEFFMRLAKMRQDERIHDALDRRVRILLATTNVNSMINSLSHLVSIVKSHHRDWSIDYARLAKDLYIAQFGNRQANQVHLRWGQQYYRNLQTIKNSEGKQN